MPSLGLVLAIASGALLIGLAGRALYVHSLHPAWRRQRRVRRACRKAFEEEAYELVRIRLVPGDPSFSDLFPTPLGTNRPRYFTYAISTTEEATPDLSRLERAERAAS